MMYGHTAHFLLHFFVSLFILKIMLLCFLWTSMSFKFSFLLNPTNMSSLKIYFRRTSLFMKWFYLRIIPLMLGRALEKFKINGIYFYFSATLFTKRFFRSIVLTRFTCFITCFLLCPHLVIWFIIYFWCFLKSFSYPQIRFALMLNPYAIEFLMWWGWDELACR
jgi:hypothetical protein